MRHDGSRARYMNNLLYLSYSYGSGPHEREVICSLLSAYRWSEPGAAYRILVYTDHPESFRELPLETRFVSADQWKEWSGPQRFRHRRKILALQDALERYGGPVVLLDGDTWLRAPVEELFRRVGPGRTLMHIREGSIARIATPLFREMRVLLESATLHDRAGNAFQISSGTDMYNAGVIGIDSSDAQLLDQVLDLTDQLCELSDLHMLEQFAFSYVLAEQTELVEADDLVFHYWPPYLHRPFRERLDGLFREAATMPLSVRAEFLFANRPRPPWPRRGKVVLKRVLQLTGIIRGRCRSNEW